MLSCLCSLIEVDWLTLSILCFNPFCPLDASIVWSASRDNWKLEKLLQYNWSFLSGPRPVVDVFTSKQTIKTLSYFPSLSLSPSKRKSLLRLLQIEKLRFELNQSGIIINLLYCLVIWAQALFAFVIIVAAQWSTMFWDFYESTEANNWLFRVAFDSSWRESSIFMLEMKNDCIVHLTRMHQAMLFLRSDFVSPKATVFAA